MSTIHNITFVVLFVSWLVHTKALLQIKQHLPVHSRRPPSLIRLPLHWPCISMTPIAERIEDVLLQVNAAKQSAGAIQPTDSIKMRLYTGEARGLLCTPEEAIARPSIYVSSSTRFMSTMVTTAPDIVADVFAGYTAISPGHDWSTQFHDASLTDKWEGFVITALQLEEEGQPRPTTLTELAQAAAERGLYRY